MDREVAKAVEEAATAAAASAAAVTAASVAASAVAPKTRVARSPLATLAAAASASKKAHSDLPTAKRQRSGVTAGRSHRAHLSRCCSSRSTGGRRICQAVGISATTAQSIRFMKSMQFFK